MVPYSVSPSSSLSIIIHHFNTATCHTHYLDVSTCGTGISDGISSHSTVMCVGGKYSLTHSSSQCNPNTSGCSSSCTMGVQTHEASSPPPSYLPSFLCVCVWVCGCACVCVCMCICAWRDVYGMGVYVGVYVWV